MSSDINIKKLSAKLKSLLNGLQKYVKFTFVITILCLNGFLVFEINRLMNKEPSAEKVSEQIQLIKRPKIDQVTIDKIEKLEDQNIAVRSLFKQARDNPFQE